MQGRNHPATYGGFRAQILIFLAVVATVRATVLPAAVVPVAVGVAETGESAQFRAEDNLGNYNFGYNEDHTSGGSFRREVGDAHGNVAGSYGLRDADGRIRIVNYLANDDGFKADIQTNEPGVEPKDPADTSINKAESVLVNTAVVQPVHPVVAQPIHSVVAQPVHSVVAVPAADTHLAVKTAHVDQVAVAHTFPEPAAVPVAKSIATVQTVEAKPAVYTFPEPAIAPIAKSIATVTRPVAYAYPEPAIAPIAQSVVTETRPVAYAFPEPAIAPVAKSVATVTETRPVAYAFPAAAPIAKSVATVTETRPVPYAFPAPAIAPVAKSIVTETRPVAYTVPAPAPIAKSSTTTVTTTNVRPAVVATDPAHLTYTFPVRSAVPVAKSAGVAHAAPAHYALPGGLAYTAPLRYALNPYYNYHHGGLYGYSAPYYNSLYSPAVSTFAGPVPYFNNIEYHGYPVVKK